LASAEELKVYALGGRRVVCVRAGQGQRLRDHLRSRGFPAGVTPTPAAGLDRLELERHSDPGTVQAVLDDWPH
jgi:hypothetical protein